MVSKILKLVLVLILANCGSSELSPQVIEQPFINFVSPNPASLGDTVEIHGFGFSPAAPTNIIILGDTALVAASFNFSTTPTSQDLETLGLVIPPDFTPGTYALTLVVEDEISNTISLTISP
ncbi:MAG: hypothetical protein HYU97_02530 [Deltaproteobacteria bacterium]|nr:hypothetical protein [Deltaproteobacteria bacterium]